MRPGAPSQTSPKLSGSSNKIRMPRSLKEQQLGSRRVVVLVEESNLDGTESETCQLSLSEPETTKNLKKCTDQSQSILDTPPNRVAAHYVGIKAKNFGLLSCVTNQQSMFNNNSKTWSLACRAIQTSDPGDDATAEEIHETLWRLSTETAPINFV